MVKKYGIYCENCNVLLNNEDDIFGSNLGQLYHSTCMQNNHGKKSADFQPIILFRMNLKFADKPTLMIEAEKECARQSVHKLKAKIRTLEDALLVKDRLKDDVNKLIDCVEKLANTLSINVVDKAAGIVNNASQNKSHKQAYDEDNLNGDDSPLTGEAEEQNIGYINSNNDVLQSVQQLEARIKTLGDTLLQTKSVGNKLTECIEMLEKNKAIGNNTTQDRNINNENNLGGEQHNDAENVASTSQQNHTCTVSGEKQEVLDLRNNCVYIDNPKRYCTSMDEALSYVRELANEMNVRIADNSVLYIDMDYPNWYVYFRDEDSKKEFLKNRIISEYNPRQGQYLQIFDYNDCGIVDIENFQSSDLSLETAFVNVLGLAKKMGMTNIRSSIDHIDVYDPEPNLLVYSVRFNRQNMANAFLQNECILKQFPETKSLIISNVGGHTSCWGEVNSLNMATASANVIGAAALMGLSLSTDNVKRIYVLNRKDIYYAYARDVHFSLVVEFFSNDIKNKFLQKKSELERIAKLWDSYIINISDIKTEGNIVSIKYNNWDNEFNIISCIGLAKQLGYSFTPDQIDRFIELSKFISNASS